MHIILVIEEPDSVYAGSMRATRANIISRYVTMRRRATGHEKSQGVTRDCCGQNAKNAGHPSSPAARRSEETTVVIIFWCS